MSCRVQLFQVREIGLLTTADYLVPTNILQAFSDEMSDCDWLVTVLYCIVYETYKQSTTIVIINPLFTHSIHYVYIHYIHYIHTKAYAYD